MTAPPSPRIFLIRHGETDWLLGGKHNSRAETTMSADGEEDVRLTRDMLVGTGKMINLRGVATIFCSPRVNARRTAEILGLGSQNIQYFYDCDSDNFLNDPDVHKQERSIRVTSMLREWDYGEYEGLTLAEIHRQRGKKDLPPWDIWEQGCPGGESPQEVSDRVDKLIDEIKKVILENSAVWPNGQIVGPAIGPTTITQQDIVCISHGHILAAVVMRWCGTALKQGPKRMLIQPGGVIVLGFEHDNIDNPALMIGRNPGRAEGTL